MDTVWVTSYATTPRGIYQAIVVKRYVDGHLITKRGSLYDYYPRLGLDAFPDLPEALVAAGNARRAAIDRLMGEIEQLKAPPAVLQLKED